MAACAATVSAPRTPVHGSAGSKKRSNPCDTITATHSQAPIRISYLRYVAEGPNCGKWPQNLAADYRNLPMDNMGCAQQRNLAAMIVNPADLVTPRAMTSVETERRAVMLDKYKKGEQTESANAKETATVKGSR